MEPKVVNFPKQPRSKPKTDEERVKAIRRAWAALRRAIADAENSGLRVERDFNVHAELKITREYRR